MRDHSYFANLVWQIADLLRGPYRPPQDHQERSAGAWRIALTFRWKCQQPLADETAL